MKDKELQKIVVFPPNFIEDQVKQYRMGHISRLGASKNIQTKTNMNRKATINEDKIMSKQTS
jgi:hypothetical protein